MNIAIAVLAAALGLLVGGAINILADDLPARRDPGLPHYPDGSPRPRSAWLGLTAFLTGQRAGPGAPAVVEQHAEAAATVDAPDMAGESDLASQPAPAYLPVPTATRLSWRYPLVELVNALAYAVLVLGFGDERSVWAWFVYISVLLLITVIDVEHRLILFVVIVPSSLFAVIASAITPTNGRPFAEYLIGGAFGFALFFAMFIGGAVFASASRHDGVAFGFGDVMLATLSGLILGWRAFIFASIITVFAGAFGALLYLAVRAMLRRRYQWFTPLPYGPYIVIGTLVMLLFRKQVQDILLSGYR